MDFSRKVPIEKGGSLGYEYQGRNKDKVIVTPDTFEECPYCAKDINTNLITSFSNSIIHCPECNGEVVVETSWICDPEDESNGEWIYLLYTVDEALENNIDINIEDK